MSSAPASQPATPNPEKESELIYGLESHPPFGSSLLAALQHILAMVLSVMAPPAIVAGALGVPPEAIAYLVSMSLLFAGIGIWFQVSRPFGIGSGMLSIQATSFAFPGTLIAVGALLMKEQGMSWEQALSTLFGVCFIGGFVVMAGSRIMPFLRKIITPTVAGITVMMIGVSLVRVGAIDLAGGGRGQGRWNIWGHLQLVPWHAGHSRYRLRQPQQEPAVAHELAHRGHPCRLRSGNSNGQGQLEHPFRTAYLVHHARAVQVRLLRL